MLDDFDPSLSVMLRSKNAFAPVDYGRLGYLPHATCRKDSVFWDFSVGMFGLLIAPLKGSLAETGKASWEVLMPRSLDDSAVEHKDAVADAVLPDVLNRICELERRVAALEHHPAPIPTSRADVTASPTPLPAVPAGVIPILGRALLGLAGAYLLRAIAESDVVPRIVTVIAALIYAGAWLVSSVRARPEETFRAAVSAITAALIFVPLLWETTVRFQALNPAASALALVMFVTAGYALAWRRGLPAISRITAFAGAGTALVLLVATHDLAPFTISLLAMAAVAEFAASRDHCRGGRWIVALSNDVALLVLAYLVSRPQGLPEGYRPTPMALVLAIQAATLGIYLGSVYFHTIGRSVKIAWLEIGQVTAILAISIGGALAVTRGAAATTIAIFCILSGAAACAAAFGRKGNRPRDLHTYAVWGLTLLLSGSAILFSGMPLTAIWGVLAILAMAAARRTGHFVLRAHACVYLIGATIISGLLRYCYAVSVEPGIPLKAIPPAAILAVCTAALCYLASGAGSTISIRIPAVIIAGLLCWSAVAIGSGALVSLGTSAVAQPTLRTFLLCAVAIGATLAGSRWGRGELLWLQYPIMFFGAVKLLVEDFPNGRPAALALSLLSYGGALILLPRCRPRTNGRDARDPEDAK